MTIKGKEVAGTAPAIKRKLGDGNDNSGRDRKRRNREILRFFEDATGVDETDDSDDCDLSDGFPEEEFDTVPPMQSEPAKDFCFAFPLKEEAIDEEEYDRMMEERFGNVPGFKFAEDDIDDKIVNSIYPLENDQAPTIWKVKCTVGRERHSAFCLMQKFVDLKILGTELRIKSAFAVDHMKGYFYIEAEKQCDINEACKGLSGIYVTRVQPVPKNDLSHLFSVQSRCNEVTEGIWVRVKNGRYKGDLAQVVAVNNARKRATVKLIPRIDLQAMAAKFGGGYSIQKNVVPPPRLISSSELEEFLPLLQYRRDRDTGKVCQIIDGLMLKDGYLYKKVSIDSLNIWGVVPKEEELLKFARSENNEANDLEWLSQIYGEPKKKRIIKGDKGGGKGEGSSGSGISNGFELYDLVCFSRKDFGVIIGMDKDDSYKILKESPDGPVAVTVERRDIKSGLFDMKLSAQDQHNKTILVNDTVRVLEGPSEGRQGVVKHIYRGVVFLYNENVEQNGGYFTAKSHMCEKIKLIVGDCSGKGSEPGPSVFEDLSSSPKSPLSPKRPWQARDNDREFKRGGIDGPYTIGQTLRIKVGPLKGYLCRVTAMRRSDVTVKLDSQQKVLTVKCEHLAEVQKKSFATASDPDSSSMKPFDLLGTESCSGGWMDGLGTSAGSDGWNCGGFSTERSAWSNRSTSSFLHTESTTNPTSSEANDSGKAWEINCTSNQNSSWGTATENNGTAADPGRVGGWGSGGGSWGQTKPKTSNMGDEKQNSGWKAKVNDVDGDQPSGWDSKSNWNTPKAPEEKSWGWNHKSDEDNKECEQRGQCSWNSGKLSKECSATGWSQGNGLKSGLNVGESSNSTWGAWKSGTSVDKKVGNPAGTSNPDENWDGGWTSNPNYMEGNQSCGWERKLNSNTPLSSFQENSGWSQKSTEYGDKEKKANDQDGWKCGKASDVSAIGSDQASSWNRGLTVGEKPNSTWPTMKSGTSDARGSRETSEGGTTAGWSENPSWKSGLSAGVKDRSNWGTFKPDASGVAENKDSVWEKAASLNNKLTDSGGSQDLKWGKKSSLMPGPNNSKEGQGEDQDGWSRRKSPDNGAGTNWDQSSGWKSRSNDGGNWNSNPGANKNGNSLSADAGGNQVKGWGQGSDWKSASADGLKQASNWGDMKSGSSSGNENWNSNRSCGITDTQNQDSSWANKTNLNSEYNENQDSNLVKHSNWSSKSQEANQKGNNNWNSNQASWKSGLSVGNEDQKSNWSSGCTNAGNQDLNCGEKSNWNSGSGNANQNTSWERRNWHSGNASNGDELGGGNEGENGDRVSGWNRGGGYCGRGGFRGRGGFQGRGERSFGDRAGDDRGYGGRGERGGFRGRGGERGGFRGKGGGWGERGGRGRRDQPGGWTNRRDFSDESSDWKKGADDNAEGWKNESGAWNRGFGEKKDWQSWNQGSVDKDLPTWNQGDGSNKQRQDWSSGSCEPSDRWKGKGSDQLDGANQGIGVKKDWQSWNQGSVAKERPSWKQGDGSNKQWQNWSSGSCEVRDKWNGKGSDQSGEAKVSAGWSKATDSAQENFKAEENKWTSHGDDGSSWNKSSTMKENKETNFQEDGWRKGPNSITSSMGWNTKEVDWKRGDSTGNNSTTGDQVLNWGQSSAADRGQSSSWNGTKDDASGSWDKSSGGSGKDGWKRNGASDKGGW